MFSAGKCNFNDTKHCHTLNFTLVPRTRLTFSEPYQEDLVNSQIWRRNWLCHLSVVCLWRFVL